MRPEEIAERILPTSNEYFLDADRQAVTDAIRQAVAEEREACAQIVENTEIVVYTPPDCQHVGEYEQAGETLAKAAEAIRARKIP